MLQTKNNLTRIIEISPLAQTVIDAYENLSIGGKKVVTPYFMNERGKKGKRVSVGKGTPEEIEKETIRLAKKHNFDLYKASVEEIRNFMVKHEIGIDCSGFVCWMLTGLIKEKTHKPIWKVLKYPMLSLPARLKRLVRPVENISVRVLTSDINSERIMDLKNIKVADMIRILGGHHILVIIEIEYDEKHNPKRFTYVNSTEYNGYKYGIRKGVVKIKDLNKYLVDQEWIDGENGINWIYKAVKDFKDDSRIVRLKALDSNS